MKKNKIKFLHVFSLMALLFISHFNYAQVRVPRINIEDFTGTEEQANAKIATLEALITDAENEGIDALKEKMTVRLAKVFLVYANWDENNKDLHEDFFDGLHTFHQTTPQNLAEHLATYERSSVITILEEGIATLTAIINGERTRKPIPNIDWSKIDYDGNQLVHEGKPIYISEYIWQPDKAGDHDLRDYFGAFDGFYVDPGHVSNENGDIAQWLRNNIMSEPSGNFGTIFFGQRRIPNWLKQKYPDIEVGEAHYIGYDISSPGSREIMTKLCEGIVPLTAGKNFSKQGYMLTNEPHWNLAGTWEVVEFSEHAKDSLRTWLQNKHTDIASLNTLWNKSFSSFDDITIDDFPMPDSERGNPIWYDIMRFNQERVTNWFTFINNEVLKHDPEAKTHIKVIPFQWAQNGRHSGLDFEALTALTGNIGNDAGTKNSLRWGGPQPWEDRYHYFWRDMAMTYDFFRSVSPDKVNYNSEGHYIQANAFTDLFLDPAYVRTVYWQSTLQGMNSCQGWFWPRKADGSLDPNSAESMGGSLIEQPRVVNEITSTLMDLTAHSNHISKLQHVNQDIRIFYSETSAINKGNHMDQIFELYESLYFEGESIGFATRNIIETQPNNDWDVILVNRSEFVTTEELQALQNYLDNGGTIIMDGESLEKDEYGRNHTTTLNTNNGGTLLTGSSVADFTTKALDLIDNKGHASRFTLSETNGIGSKGCMWRSYTSNEGEEIINIVNIGKTQATLSIGLKGTDNALICTDLLTGETFGEEFTMQPETVYLLSVRERTNADNRFTIVTTSETCPDQDNGEIEITADVEQNYIATFNGVDTNFTKELTLNDIMPGTYELCIRAEGLASSTCYNLEIKQAESITGKSSVDIKSSKMSVKIEEGTAPYTVSVNDVDVYQTRASSFGVEVNQGDVVKIKTDVDCEGLMIEKVDFLNSVRAYPNPTTGLIELAIPVAEKSIPVNIYGLHAQLISSKIYPVVSGKIILNIQDKPDGIYFAEVLFDRPVNVKIVKK
ncbi:beta-galactosidase [Flavivirga algicola]|uniref:Glycoside hydrolase family 42 N-terminal domain-containing protein n=1 Tax=Flavivirga algicola TaxID=2729136 RepID=A0ABX1RTF2_9FLAO|nr:beta-galactosidase [Flavivirga algicola]NMH86837.1 hypothetical protein [Flavivirga algicola]